MARLWTIPAVVILAAAMASGAAAQDTSATVGTAEISERGGVEGVGEVIFQDIVIAPSLTGLLVASSEVSANVTVIGGGAAVSLAVPETIGVTRAGGLETITVLTSTTGDYTSVLGLEGLLADGGVLSVDVGGALTVSSKDLAPGEYRGLLTVVAQYN